MPIITRSRGKGKGPFQQRFKNSRNVGWLRSDVQPEHLESLTAMSLHRKQELNVTGYINAYSCEAGAGEIQFIGACRCRDLQSKSVARQLLALLHFGLLIV